MITMGASEVAVALGLSRQHDDGEPYVSEYTLQQRLLGEIPRYDRDPDNLDAEVGRWMEPAVAGRFAAEHHLTPGYHLLPGPTLDEPGDSHPDLPWLHVRVDLRFATARSWVELKAPRELDPERWGPGPSADDLPAEYLVQLVTQGAVLHRRTGATHGYLAALARAPRRGQRVYGEWLYERDPKLEEQILGSAWAWYVRHVVERKEVAADGSASTRSTMDRRWAGDADTELYANAATRQLVRTALQRREALRVIEQACERDEAEIKAAMRDATVLKAGARTIATWRTGKSGRRYFRLIKEK